MTLEGVEYFFESLVNNSASLVKVKFQMDGELSSFVRLNPHSELVVFANVELLSPI